MLMNLMVEHNMAIKDHIDYVTLGLYATGDTYLDNAHNCAIREHLDECKECAGRLSEYLSEMAKESYVIKRADSARSILQGAASLLKPTKNTQNIIAVYWFVPYLVEKIITHLTDSNSAIDEDDLKNWVADEIRILVADELQSFVANEGCYDSSDPMRDNKLTDDNGGRKSNDSLFHKLQGMVLGVIVIREFKEPWPEEWGQLIMFYNRLESSQHTENQNLHSSEQ